MQEVGAVASFAELLGQAQHDLVAAGVPSSRLDAEVLLCAAMAGNRAALYARLPDRVPATVEERFRAAVRRRQRREPVAYITGTKEFWSLPIRVTPDVLIPRPETELLVQWAVRVLAESATKAPLICDVGTGSGCVAVALGREVPAARVIAVDVSEAALEVARRNIEEHGLAARVKLVRSNLFAETDPALRFDLIVSNPPYVGAAEGLDPELLWEPPGALRAGADGLAVVNCLLDAAPRRLRPGGWLLMEIGAGQADAAVRRARAAGLAVRTVATDLAGIPRTLVAWRPPPDQGTRGR